MLAQQAKLLPRLLGHQTLSSILSEAPGSGTLVSHVVAPWHRSIARSPDRADSHGSQEALEQIVQDFGSNPQDVSQQLAAKLSTSQKAALAAALAQHTDQHELNEDYFNELFKAADNDANSELNRREFQSALLAHQTLQNKADSKDPPSFSALRMIFFASAIPFVGFGFLDNFLMLIFGEEIDHLFGAKLGFTTLASAGLGNAVADVVGVGAANYIERAVRKLSFIKDPKLSKTQRNMPSARRAKLGGAVVGVAIGCLLGLTPLFWSDTFFVHH